MKTPTERFWAKVQKSDTCWLWVGHIAKSGYGMAWDVLSQRVVKAHRKSWELSNGSIPDALCVLHKCDVRNCVRPSHLFLGTRKDNAEDRDRKGRLVKRSAPIGELNPKAKLSEGDVLRIRRLYRKRDISQTKLSQLYGVSQAQISEIVLGKVWKHLDL